MCCRCRGEWRLWQRHSADFAKCADNSGPTLIQRVGKLCESEASVVGTLLQRLVIGTLQIISFLYCQCQTFIAT